MTTVQQIKAALQKVSSSEKAKTLARFFKTGPGQYGEGDQFIGVTVPEQRKVTQRFYKEISLDEVAELLHSPIHEHRLTALLMLVAQFEKLGKKDANLQEQIYNFYLKNTKWINNWDLVDLSAYKIVGPYLKNNPELKPVLYKLVKSSDLWERRISVLATFHFIKQGEFVDILKLSEILLEDKHDLMHKAVGWMLREMGKKEAGKNGVLQQGQSKLLEFLDKYYQQMPRTMLRYSLERLTQEQKDFYMGRTSKN